MEEKEERYDEGEDARENVRDHDEDCATDRYAVDVQGDDGDASRGENYHYVAQGGVKQRVEEVLVVVEPNTIANPIAMMVHFEHASVALAAVMRAVGLHSKAALADANATILLSLDRKVAWLPAGCLFVFARLLAIVVHKRLLRLLILVGHIVLEMRLPLHVFIGPQIFLVVGLIILDLLRTTFEERAAVCLIMMSACFEVGVCIAALELDTLRILPLRARLCSFVDASRQPVVALNLSRQLRLDGVASINTTKSIIAGYLGSS